jgi:hypothetical protein
MCIKRKESNSLGPEALCYPRVSASRLWHYWGKGEAHLYEVVSKSTDYFYGILLSSNMSRHKFRIQYVYCMLDCNKISKKALLYYLEGNSNDLFEDTTYLVQ